MKRPQKILLTFFVFLTILLAFALTSEAAAKKPSCEKSITGYYVLGVVDAYAADRPLYLADLQYGSAEIKVKHLAENAKITNIKSSRSDIAIAYKSYDGKSIMVWAQDDVKKIKTGTTTISFTVTQNGKSYHLSCKYSVKIAEAPFKSFKINGTDYSLRVKEGNIHSSIKTGKTAKIKFSKILTRDKAGVF